MLKLPKQQSLNFYPGLFYKPQTIIKIRKNIIIKSLLKNFKQLHTLKNKDKFFYQKKFNLNLNESQYQHRGILKRNGERINTGKTELFSRLCQK